MFNEERQQTGNLLVDRILKGTSKNTFIRGVFDPVGIGSMKIGQYDPFDVKNALKLMAFYPSSAFFLGNRRINP